MIGFIEKCEPSEDFSWVKKLEKINVVSAKILTDSLIECLIENKNRIIFHHGVSGLGPLYEPKVPSVEWSVSQYSKLISSGFPVRQTVLRLSPFIPNDYGVGAAQAVLEKFKDTELKRIRVHLLRAHLLVVSNFYMNGIDTPYKRNYPEKAHFQKVSDFLARYADRYFFESCDDFNVSHIEKNSCVTIQDFRILGLSDEPVKNANCLQGKKDLVTKRVGCDMGCLYCYNTKVMR